MAKKKTNKKIKNVFLLIILIFLFIVGGFIFLQNQTHKSPELLVFPTPEPVKFGNIESDITREPLEKITVYLSDGTETYGWVGKNWNNGRFALIDFIYPNGAGSNGIGKYIDGKWVSIDFSTSQSRPCADYIDTGLSQSDLNDLGIKNKDGICSE